MRIWKDYTTKDAIVIVKKPVKTIKPETISSCGGNCFQMLCVTSQDLWQSSSRKLWKRLWMWQKKIGWWLWRVSEYGSWRNSRANRHHTRGIIRRWLSASEPVPDNGEDVPEAVPEKKTNKKLTLDKSQKGSDFSRLLLHSFMTWMISPMIWALKWMVGGFSLYRNILREMKSEVRQKLWYISIVTLSVPDPPAALSTSSPSLVSATPETARPTFLCSLLNMEMARMKTFMMIYFHLMNSKWSSCCTVNKLICCVCSCKNLITVGQKP